MGEILVAEDEEHIAKLVSFKLTRDGHKVTIAKNGQEALDRLSERKWSLMVLDVMMPVFDGWHVLKTLRTSTEASNLQAELPVLMLTAKGHERDQASAAELGATRFLRKPFDPAELSVVVKELVG